MFSKVLQFTIQDFQIVISLFNKGLFCKEFILDLLSIILKFLILILTLLSDFR